MASNRGQGTGGRIISHQDADNLVPIYRINTTTTNERKQQTKSRHKESIIIAH